VNENVTETLVKDRESSRGHGRAQILDPVSRTSEVLFGLIMVLTFTLPLQFEGTGRDDFKAMFLALLGCNFAWAVIDAILYLMGTRGEHRLSTHAIDRIREAENPEAGRAFVSEFLPSAVSRALTENDLETIRQRLLMSPTFMVQPAFTRQDYLAAFAVFLLVFTCLFPVALPLILLHDLQLALRASNAVAVIMLFLTGFQFGRHVGRPWQTAFLIMAVGLALVGVAMTFGG
jgi:hypothetical protein